MKHHLAVVLCLLVAGCSSTPPNDVDSSLASLTRGSVAGSETPLAKPTLEPAKRPDAEPGTLAAMAERSGQDLQRAIDEIAAKAAQLPTNENPAPAASVTVTRDAIGPRVPSPSEYAAAWNEAALGGEPPPDPNVEASTAEGGTLPGASIAQRVEELADLMRERLDQGADPMPARAALTIVESLLPPDAPREPIPPGALTPEQSAALDVLRESLTIFVTQSDPSVVAGSFESLSARLSGAKPFRIAKAELCSRVRGYGQYDPLPVSTFVMGRPLRAIVYVEVEGFGHRGALDADHGSDATSGNAWSVELSQELNLYKDRVMAWTRPAQRVVESSRNRRRDFYLVHEIDLPRNLGIGKYGLKVVMRDIVTDAIDEAIIPITIVADESALDQPTPR